MHLVNKKLYGNDPQDFFAFFQKHFLKVLKYAHESNKKPILSFSTLKQFSPVLKKVMHEILHSALEYY